MRSNPDLDALSPFEWILMNHLWELGNASARELNEALPEDARRAYTTIQTCLERLVDKRYLSKEKTGMVNFYTAQVAREDVVDGATARFIDRVFHGSGSSLAAYLVKHKKLEDADIQKIRDILDEGGEHV